MWQRLFGGIHDQLWFYRLRHQRLPSDLTEAEVRIVRFVRAFTMVPVERLAATIQAAHYVARHQIPGAIVECGVWRGGAMMAMAMALQSHHHLDRSLFLFDTFQGMPRPSTDDGPVAQRGWLARQAAEGSRWCHASLADVQRNLWSTGYPQDRMHFVQGRVEETIPGMAPAQIALLRLDTDWYESTRHEMEHLFPRLSPGGVLIIDDYGWWPGCRKAVDEYIAEHRLALLLCRVDNSGRVAVKPWTAGVAAS
jgi:hypothetical protein